MKLHNSGLCDYCLPTVNIIPPKLLCCTFTIIFMIHLINAIGSQKVTCLCLLSRRQRHVTAFAFYQEGKGIYCCLRQWHHRPQHLTHSSLISVRYPWLCSLLLQVLLIILLSFRSFRVKCDNNLSSLHTSSCNVPQDSVLGFLFFIMYTTPLSTPISSSPLTTTKYADDTHLFFSFHPLNFESSISHLQNAL